MSLPPRPEGVRIVHADGSETICELSFVDFDEDGIAIWSVLSLRPVYGQSED